MSCDTHVTLVRPAKSAVRLPELKQHGEGGSVAAFQSGSAEPRLQKRNSDCVEARRPWELSTMIHVEVSGATLDAHWLHAASVLFCKCGLPPYSRVVPVDPSSLALVV